MLANLLSLALLRLVLSRDRAAAVLGDLTEESARRRPRFPRLWLARQALLYTAAALLAALPRIARAARLTVRDARRGLAASPSTTVAAVLILALGLAAATVTFSVVDHVVLRGLPFDEADRIVAIEGVNRNATRAPRVDPADYHAWRTEKAFASVAMWHPPTPMTLRRGAETERLPYVAVTSSLFDVLRVRPLAGRLFDPIHHTAGRDRVALVSHEFWQRALGGAADVVGRLLETTGEPIQIVGVMPRGFRFPLSVEPSIDIWRPYVPRPGEESLAGREGRTTDAHVLARLADGASIELARTQASAISARQAAAFPRAYDGWAVHLTTLHESLIGSVRTWMVLLLVAVALVMAVACVNVASLLLARATARARDFAVRAALGASRRRLVAALTLEGLMLAGTAAALGVLAAYWGVETARAALPEGIARAAAIALDARVLAAAIAATIATGLCFGVVPAWHARRVDPTDALRDAASASARPSRRRWQRAFLVAETSLVVLLLVVAALFVASFARVTGLDLGFERANLAGVRPLPASAGVPAAERVLRENAIIDRAVEVVSRLPGVASVAVSAWTDLPFGFVWDTRLESADASSTAVATDVDLRGVSAGYFETAGIAIVRGRGFDARDREGQPSVAIIDERAARQLFGDADPVGRRVRFGTSTSIIVGVAANVRLHGPEGRTTGQFYYALSQSPRQGQRQLVIRTAAPVAHVLPAIEATVASLVPPGSRRAQVVVLEDRFRALTAGRRFNAGLMTIFGALALVIGAAGVYSVMAFVVGQRTRDLGVRVALGATRGAVLRLVLAGAGAEISVGAAIGLAAAWAISGVFASQLFGLAATDPAVYAVVALVMMTVGLGAAYLPARRAARVDPIAALRQS
jgi:predicted permease